MRITELKGRQVVDPTTARKRGTVVDVVVDPTTARLVGVIIVGNDEGSPKDIACAMIARIGREAIMLRRQVDCDLEILVEGRDKYLDYESLVGLEVLDEGGDRVGRLQDARIDPDRLVITAYALVDAGWRRWLHRATEIGPGEVTSWSRDLMLIEPRTGVGPGFLTSEPHRELSMVARTLDTGTHGSRPSLEQATYPSSEQPEAVSQSGADSMPEAGAGMSLRANRTTVRSNTPRNGSA